jgi:hypothetical protein
MIHAKGLPLNFGGEAVNTAVYILNRTGTAITDYVTPLQLWCNRIPDVRHMHVFGADAYVHIPKQLRFKMDSKSKLCKFLGYDSISKAYKLWDTEKRKIITARDVLFNDAATVLSSQQVTSISASDQVILQTTDRSSIEAQQQAPPVQVQQQELPGETQQQNLPEAAQPQDIPQEEAQQEQNVPMGVRHVQNDQVGAQHEENTLQRPHRNRVLPARLGDCYLYGDAFAGCVESLVDDPVSYEAAMSSPQKSQWEQALKEEYTSLTKNETWTLTELPKGRRPIQCKWVYKTKYKSDGTIDQYKARLVAKGFTQSKGIDYQETYAPVVRYETARMFLSIIAVEDYELVQFDVKTTYLNVQLTETIYMIQPLGFIAEGQETLVCLLERSLYGLKQSARYWNRRFSDFLLKYNLQQSLNDPCLFYDSIG